MKTEFSREEIIKFRLRLSLKFAGDSLNKIAEELGITRTHVFLVLYKGRESPRVWNHVVEQLGFDPRIETSPEFKSICQEIAFPNQARRL